MSQFFQKYHRFIFYSVWLILGLVQAYSTELIADEAYYWVYSRFPSWGYFDHPPMIAFIIKPGYSLFQNELGVRLICVLMSTLTVLITQKLIVQKNPSLFYTIVLSLGVFQIAGFLAVPDTPLLFFTALFFYAYRYFLANMNLKGVLFLSITIALLFYSKYHGLLIVGFTALSNIKLLTRWQTWLTVLLVTALFAPHLYWQYENNWISFRYHLFESDVNTYKFSITTDYLLGQLLLAGPLSGLILLPAAFLYRSKNETEKALKYVIIGIYLFFFISTFRGKIEPNWTMPVLIPLIVVSYQYLNEKNSWIKPFRIIAAISLLLIIAGRIYIVADIGPDNSVKKRFHFNKEWAMAIANRTADKPVVFLNSYQRASMFWFYAGRPSHSINAYGERRNNYDFWPVEESLLGKEVFIADIYDMYHYTDSVKTKQGWTGWKPDSLFAAPGSIVFVIDEIKPVIGNNKILNISFNSQMSQHYKSFLLSHPELQTRLIAGIFKGRLILKEAELKLSAGELANTSVHTLLVDCGSIEPGKFDLRLAIQLKDYPPTHNSEKTDIIIK